MVTGEVDIMVTEEVDIMVIGEKDVMFIITSGAEELVIWSTGMEEPVTTLGAE